MAHLPVTDKVNNNVMVEFLSVLGSCLEHEINIFHAVSIDMENRSVDSLRKIRRVHSGSSLVWGRGETNLVVDDDMDSATNSVILEVLHLHRFVDNSLARESCVTVDKNRADLASGSKVTTVMLLSSDLAHHDWVNALKM